MRWTFALLLVPLLLGGKCGGGDGSGGSGARFEVRSSDPRCVALPDIGGFPPGYDFVPNAGGAPGPTRLLAATSARSNLIPLAIERVPFRVPNGSQLYELPSDADGDGFAEFFKSIGSVRAVSSSLAFVTVSGSDAVLFVDPGAAGSRTGTLSVPLGFDPATFASFPGLPAPGTSQPRTGVTTAACIDAGAGALDSRGDRLVDVLSSPFCGDVPGVFPTSFTAASAVSGGRLFVAMSNVGERQGREDTQFLPGAVVVYDLTTSPLAVAPTRSTPDGRPYIVTTAFNPTSVTPFTTGGGRELLLVTHTGAIGIRADDPNTDDLESGAIAITDGAIDVIDVAALEVVATIPLVDANPGFDGLAIDPTGRVALLGEVNARWVYGIDLDVVSMAPPAGSGGPPPVLAGAVIFDGLNPLVLPHLAGGAPEVTCPGQVAGVAFNAAGDAAYALDTCDGTLTALAVDLGGNPSTAALRSRIAVSTLPSAVTAPVRVDTLGRVRRPASLRVRPGTPGDDYSGPDVFFTIGEPEGFVCGVRIDSP